MRKLADLFGRSQEGAAIVEYALLISFIAVVCVVAVTTLGTNVSAAFSITAASLGAALGPAL